MKIMYTPMYNPYDKKFLQMVLEWRAHGGSLTEYLKSKGYEYSEDPVSEFRKVGQTLLAAVGSKQLRRYEKEVKYRGKGKM